MKNTIIILMAILLLSFSSALEWEFAQIGSLQVGDVLMDSDGNEVPIRFIEKAYGSEGVIVYDLEVADYHYYFADGVLAHNSGEGEENEHNYNLQDRVIYTNSKGEEERGTITGYEVGPDNSIVYIVNGKTIVHESKIIQEELSVEVGDKGYEDELKKVKKDDATDSEYEGSDKKNGEKTGLEEELPDSGKGNLIKSMTIKKTKDKEKENTKEEETTKTKEEKLPECNDDCTTIEKGGKKYNLYKDKGIWEVREDGNGKKIADSINIYSYDNNEKPDAYSYREKDGRVHYIQIKESKVNEMTSDKDGSFSGVPGLDNQDQKPACSSLEGGCKFWLNENTGQFAGKEMKDGEEIWARYSQDGAGKYVKRWETGGGLFSDTTWNIQGPDDNEPRTYDRCIRGGTVCINKDGKYFEIKADGSEEIVDSKEFSGWDFNSEWFGNLLSDWASATAGYSGMSLFYEEPDPIIELDETISNMLGGIDGWTSEICKSDVSEAVSNYGTAFSAFPSGGAYAHIEGTKIKVTNYNTTTPIDYYLYKISFSVSSGSDEYRGCDIDFRVYIKDGITKSLFKNSAGADWTFKTKRDGGENTISYAGTSMIAAQSQTNYNQLCLEFKNINPNIVTPIGGYQTNCLIGIDSGDEMCVNIVDDGAKMLETKDPCDSSALSFFMPLCWGSTTENRQWKSGDGIGGTSTSGSAATGTPATGPILNI